jgi:oligopeptide/dipeptide ABC transporter ATP-binding protein
MVGCDPTISSYRPRELGAGILQRINIARALAPEPACIVLDEPTSMLEPSQRLEVTELLRRLQHELGTAYLFISHDLTTIASLCHQVAVMYLGQIVELGAAREIFAHPRHPYTRALLDASLVADVTRRRVDRIETEQLTGAIPSPIDLPTGCFLASRCLHAHEQCNRTAQSLTPFHVAPASSSNTQHWVRCWRAAAQPLVDEVIS